MIGMGILVSCDLLSMEEVQVCAEHLSALQNHFDNAIVVL
jgi:hypothetical protein